MKPTLHHYDATEYMNKAHAKDAGLNWGFYEQVNPKCTCFTSTKYKYYRLRRWWYQQETGPWETKNLPKRIEKIYKQRNGVCVCARARMPPSEGEMEGVRGSERE